MVADTLRVILSVHGLTLDVQRYLDGLHIAANRHKTEESTVYVYRSYRQNDK